MWLTQEPLRFVYGNVWLDIHIYMHTGICLLVLYTVAIITSYSHSHIICITIIVLLVFYYFSVKHNNCV